jgi:hypothetical protein
MGAVCGTALADLKRAELIVQRTDDHYQHYWRDGAGWHGGPIIT